MSFALMSRRDFAVLLAAATARFRIPRLSSTSAADSQWSVGEIASGHAFPRSDYTPFGYLDNPGHSAVLHRSGVLRSVPPLGFGWWARRMPWPYGGGTLRQVNYLSFLHLSFIVDGRIRFHRSEDFSERGVTIISSYHTKNLFSYDWRYEDLGVSVSYALATPDALLARVEIRNSRPKSSAVTIHATNIYGFPEENWWGSDGIASTFVPDPQVALSKIWAYGDIFALAADRQSRAGKGTTDTEEWERWIESNDLSRNAGKSSKFPGATYTVQSYEMDLPAGRRDAITISLVRSVNQHRAMSASRSSLHDAPKTIRRKLDEDDRFYSTAPLLTGGWPQHWIHGWIYDFETLRMTMRPPLGIYKHRWDGMQVFTPRAVLGETVLDSMALSYADMPLAKEVILGMFADAVAPNLPCSREDGSVNMICANGSEVGTAPQWGMPFHVIRSVYVRSHDAAWIAALYPHMRRFLNWWLTNRTDSKGWFHCKCSWESGQDASKRFLIAGENPGAAADIVRTVDVEAAMAKAFLNMALLCEAAGFPQDKGRWSELGRHRVETTRAMFVNGWFRDFDSRNNQPIILKDYYDVMMLYPLAAGITTEEQTRALTPWLKYFADHPRFWLEWPSFMFPFSEAAWNAGQREFIGEIVAGTADRVYRRTDARHTRGIAPFESTLPEQFKYRIPGVADEFWPMDEENPGGCENYGWGATLPMLLLRNVIGFRELDDPARDAFRLAPALPAQLLKKGGEYGIRNLRFRSVAVHLEYQVASGSDLTVRLRANGTPRRMTVTDGSGRRLASAADRKPLEFRAANGAAYTVEFSV